MVILPLLTSVGLQTGVRAMNPKCRFYAVIDALTSQVESTSSSSIAFVSSSRRRPHTCATHTGESRRPGNEAVTTKSRRQINQKCKHACATVIIAVLHCMKLNAPLA